MKEKANYGNWVPEKALYMLFGAAVILGVIAVIAQAGFHKPVIAVIVGVIGVLVLAEAVYMLICHETFAFGKGNMMAGVHEHLVKHLDWNVVQKPFRKRRLRQWTTGELSGVMRKSSVKKMHA